MMSDEQIFPRVCKINDSSVITEIAYDHGKRLLQVTFRTGSVWQYDAVYQNDFSRLVGSHSVGSLFNALIRNRYDGRRVYPEPPKEIIVPK